MDQASTGAGEATMGAFRRRKWLAILVFAEAFAAAASIIVFLPDIYRSSATVLIERQQIPDDLVKSTVTGLLETRMQTISQEIMSRARLEALIERFGLYENLKDRQPMERVVERMRKDIGIELKAEDSKKAKKKDRTTIAFAVSYAGRDPQKVAQVTNTLASFYIEENLKVRERQAMGTAEFLRVQLDEVKAKLQQQEKQVSVFKERSIGELPEQMQANLSTLERLNSQLRVNNDNQVKAAERRAALVRQLTEAEAAAEGGGPVAISARLGQLHKELTELRGRYSDRYPDVVRVKAEIARLEAQLSVAKREEEQPQKPVMVASTPQILQLKRNISDAEVEMAGFKTEAENLKRSIAAYQRRVENTPRRDQEFQSLSREYEATKELHRSIAGRYREAELGESMEQRQKGEQFRILDSATVPLQPTAPNRLQLLLLGLLLSLGLAVATVLFVEQLDTSFHSVEDLRALSRVPVLVSIPRIVTAKDRRTIRRRAALVTVGAMVALGLTVGGSYMVAREEGSLPSIVLR